VTTDERCECGNPGDPTRLHSGGWGCIAKAPKKPLPVEARDVGTAAGRAMFVTFTSGPDKLGRRRFTLEWNETEGCFRHELGRDGQPVGYRRGQMFFTEPRRHLRRLRKRGFKVVVKREAESQRPAT